MNCRQMSHSTLKYQILTMFCAVKAAVHSVNESVPIGSEICIYLCGIDYISDLDPKSYNNSQLIYQLYHWYSNEVYSNKGHIERHSFGSVHFRYNLVDKYLVCCSK